MLDDSLKKTIQRSYSAFLKAKDMTPRYGQKLMIAAIARALGNIDLDEDGHNTGSPNIAVVEAGTGTGKTVAYLVSTIPMAKTFEKQVVLSTATVALQEQIVVKDLPDLLCHSGLSFSFVLAKGRGRYVCLSKLERIVTDSQSQMASLYEDEIISFSPQQKQLYRSMLKKTVDGEWDGDKDNWNDEIETDSWQRVTTDHRQCTGRKCANIRDCAFYNARAELDEADVIVANHDLLLADLALGGGAILSPPEDTVYILDEGHHLPEKALNHFAANTRYRSTIRWLGQSEGQWPNHLKPLEELSYFVQLAAPLEAQFKQVRSIMEEYLPFIRTLCEAVELDQKTPRLRFKRGEVGEQLEALAKEVGSVFVALNVTIEKLYSEVSTLVNEDSAAVSRSDLETMMSLLGAWLSRAEANVSLWQSYRDTAFEEKKPYARWITIHDTSDILDYEFVSSPVLASGILSSHLWTRCCGSVVTSATLRALNSFDRFKMRVGLGENAIYTDVPSPFDFANNATLSVPVNTVEANRSIEHTESLIEIIPEIVDLNSSTLVLFSSHVQMNAVYEGMPDNVKICIHRQGDASKQRIIASHKRAIDAGEGSIIWGLSSFSEGVDLPGDYCRHVIIAKLPFSVPDEPLESAFSEWVEARGGNAFMEVTVPDASTKLIQATGRLLRTETDTGTVTILDKRIVSKRYGSALIDALPPFRRNV